MSFLKSLLNDAQAVAHFVEGKPNAPAQAAAPTNNAMPVRQAQQQAAPDFTYNPNPNTNVPYSSHDPVFAARVAGQAGKGFIPYADPQAAQVTEIPSLLRGLLTRSINLGVDPTNPQGGTNNGYSPVQNSQSVNPQLRMGQPAGLTFDPQGRQYTAY